MVLALVLVSIVTLASLIALFIFIRKTLKLSGEKVKLDGKVVELLENHLRDYRALKREYRDKLKQYRHRRVIKGAYFYYPDGYNFKQELVGKRSKIVDLELDVETGRTKVHSRLVDEAGRFIDDTTWNGDITSAVNYIFEPNEHLSKFRHKFLNEIDDTF